MRGQVTGHVAGRQRQGLVHGRRQEVVDSFTYTAKNESANKVLLMAAEDYTGPSSDRADGRRQARPYLELLRSRRCRTRASATTSTTSTPQRRTAPTPLGVLSHYKAVIWYTGDDLYVARARAARRHRHLEAAARRRGHRGARLHERGRQAAGHRQVRARRARWDQFLYNPLGPTPPNPCCKSNQTAGNGDADDPVGQIYNCIVVSNDFQQYWLGAYLPIDARRQPGRRR